MSGNVKTIDPSSNLCEAVAALNDGDTLVLSPGVYNVDKPVVVGKDVLIRSSTGSPGDVAIVRAGSTAALIDGGAPAFENLTFASISGTGESKANDEIRYESCVAVRGGSPTFVGCRATSADQSGFSVRGEGVWAKLVRCEARGTKHGGIFFDGRATGLIDKCVFADTGLGCVDVEDTPEGLWVEIRDSRLIKSGYASLNLHNRGRVRITDSELVAYDTSCAEVNENSTLEARSTQFRGLIPFDPEDEDAPWPAGIGAFNSSVRVAYSTFKDFNIGIYIHDSSVTLERCLIADGNKSIVASQDGSGLELKECQLFKDPEFNVDLENGEEVAEKETGGDAADRETSDDLNDDFGFSEDDLDDDFDDDVGEGETEGEEEQDEDEFSDEEWEKAYEIKGKKIEELLGPAAPMVRHAIIPYAIGGPMHAIFYPNSQYGGTFIASEELVDPNFNKPGNASFHSFELTIATRNPLPAKYSSREGAEKAKAENDKTDKNHLSFLMKALKNGDPEEQFDDAINRYVQIMTSVGRYIESGATINRYETLEFPKDYDLDKVAGSCFIFDVIGTPLKPDDVSLQKALSYFDRDPYAIPEEDEKNVRRDPDKEGTFGLLLLIELNRSEMNYARKIGGANFIKLLKEENVWPFSDLDRKKVK